MRMDEEFKRIVTTNKVGLIKESPEDKRGYGYGFNIKESKNGRSYGHGGGAPGINAWFSIYEGENHSVITLANYDPTSAEIIARKIKYMIGGVSLNKYALNPFFVQKELLKQEYVK